MKNSKECLIELPKLQNDSEESIATFQDYFDSEENEMKGKHEISQSEKKCSDGSISIDYSDSM